MKHHVNLIIVLMLFLSISALAQENLTVDLGHPVYHILKIAEIKGALTNLSRVKPYSKSAVIRYLETAYDNRSKLDAQDLVLIESYLNEFKSVNSGFEHGNQAVQGGLGLFMAGVCFESDYRVNINDLSNVHMFNGLRLYMKGDISDFFSYYGCFGVTYDKVDPQCFAPYSFSKQWDGFHLGFGDPRYSDDGIEPYPYFSFILENELTAQFFNDDLTIRFARLRRDWGEGAGNLYLSESARPFEGVELHARLAPGVNIAYNVGSLGNWLQENQLSSTNLSFQKMLTLQMLEFFPFDWCYVSVTSVAVWGKRFELGYLNPLMYPVLHQNLHGNFDNVAQIINCSFDIAGFVRVHGSLFVDEMELVNLSELFTRPRNMFAVQCGVEIPIPGLPATLLTLQYTKIEPFVYAHYPEEYVPTMGTDVDMSFTHDNENLGYYLPPNSDEFLIKIEALLLHNLLVGVKYQLIRHGTNDWNLLAGAPVIYGDVNIPFDYDQEDAYPDKSFLNDGIYDWNNIITLEATYTFPQFPVSLTVLYSFCYITWDANDSGVSPPDDVVKNIISVKVKIF
ncbi:MAG: hypothetical protein JW822_06655 [Spirochaetales bacterium]|nr:hypothetical protein [Spirochaetales bacterium]